ncbi:crossover junction endodeoxyribonuclease RuvC [Patescibacteria group bacterium]|jgi:crossover junction endodeoxyribonuclease RuvC|nr:crossover junction endodeoxyribonuclease RuvC [Patescibacteria group bacterium]
MKGPHRIIGFDPGYGRLGFGVIAVSARFEPTLVRCGVITTSKDMAQEERLREIATDVRAIIEKEKPDVVMLEDLFFAKSVTTALKVAEVRGVLQLIAADFGLPVFNIKPIEVKVALTGYGKADKKQMQDMVALTLKLPHPPSPDDAADAVAIALAGMGRIGG